MDLFGSLFGQPKPVDWELKRLIDEQRVRHMGEYGGLKIVANPRIRPDEIGLSYDGGKTIRHRVSLSTFAPTPEERGTEDARQEPSDSPRPGDP